jgi:hypothetical protein
MQIWLKRWDGCGNRLIAWSGALTRQNFSQGSRSTNALELKAHLQDRTNAIVSLVRSNLREDIADGLDAYDWQSNPHLNLYCQMAAAQNYAMYPCGML